MGIKSGRATILLDVVLLTISDQYKESGLSIEICSDLVSYVEQLRVTRWVRPLEQKGQSKS